MSLSIDNFSSHADHEIGLHGLWLMLYYLLMQGRNSESQTLSTLETVGINQ